MQIENIHAPYEKSNTLWLNDGLNSSEIVEQYKGCIMDCAHYHIPTLVIHLTEGDYPPTPSQIGLDRFKYIVEFSEKKGVNIALENLRRPDYLDFIFTNINSARLGFCYDSGHENCYTSNVDLLERYGNKLVALHLHDNSGKEDEHKIPGEGNINWSSVAEKIDSLKYQGPLTLEVMNGFPERSLKVGPDEFLALAFHSLKKEFLK